MTSSSRPPLARGKFRAAGFHLHPVAQGCALSLVLSASALAQEAQTVQVTGIRAAIESAVSAKKNAAAIVETLNSEDIGKMPDPTMADSISRLPGVTLQRDQLGRPKNVSVRGMSPDFNGTTLNGREMASTGDSRGVEFDQFPAELISSVMVHKTPNASLIGQGLAATIDMNTVRPLDYRKRTLAVGYRKMRNGVSTGLEEGDGDRKSFSYVDQFADRTIGVAFGYAKTNETGAVVSNGGGNAWGRWEQPLTNGAGTVIGPAGFGEDVTQDTYKREGMMAVLQFKPNKNFETSLDLFRSKGNFSKKRTGIEGAIACQVDQPTNNNCTNFPYDPLTSIVGTPTITTVDGKDYMSSGTVNGVKGVLRNHLEGGDDSLNAVGWNTKFKAAGFDFLADIARSKVKRESDRFETTAGVPGRSTVAQVGTASWTNFVPGSETFEKNLTLGGIDYANRSAVKLTDVNGWSGGETFPQAGYNAHPTVTDNLRSGRFGIGRDVELGPITRIEGGVHLNNREKMRVAPEGVLRIIGGDPYGAATIPGSGTTFLPTLGINVASFDPRGSVGTIFERVAKVDKDILNKDWSVEEKVTTAYAKADLDTQLFGLPVTGNVGAQLVRTRQTSQGFNVDSAVCTDAASCAANPNAIGRTSESHSYNDFNPSLNLAMSLGGDQFLRMGLAKTITRPNMNDMRASMSVSEQNFEGAVLPVGNAGNPKLEPFRAKAFDLSYEKYFGTKGYVGAAAFYKRLDTYILTGPVFNVDFSDYAAAHPGVSPVGVLIQPQNGSGGRVSGIELSANLPFNMLASALNGFGAQFSYSRTNSSLKLPVSGFKVDSVDLPTLPLPGLSKTVMNLRMYYENHGLQVSVGARKRSDFLGEISNFQDDRALTFIKGDTVVDAQVAYEFGSGWLKGLSLTVQGSNLTNQEFERYRDVPANALGKIKYGKSYQFGLNYKI